MAKPTAALLILCTGILAAHLFAADPPATAPATRPLTPAQRAFARIKKLDGEWRGQSTRGWTDNNTWRVIAGGSCVMHTSFDAHPNETMATLFHMDGEHLMLTHYCIARNQPRLRATEISEDGRTVTFTFLDATNLRDRNQGHMDKAVYTFESDDRYTTRWTWYHNGEERWMEEIACTRVK
jgi:hypothetical protein